MESRQQLLLAWYRRHARTLPWRSAPTPYAVLLSELMLQQTRVETVIPYFHAFLARWPTLEALAAADESDVVEAWAGLGYYSRARNLHRTACAASGGLPRTARELALLPGLGPYTAGAIASIAFGERTPLVDGNVERVLSRLDGLVEDPRSPRGKRALWARAAALHETLDAGEHPGDLNQALMELGATVCVPRNPSCTQCPVRESCAGHASGEPERYPTRAPKAPPVAIHGAAAIVRRETGILLGRRAPGGLLGGLWEPVRAGDASELLGRLGEMGLRGVKLTPLGAVVHVFTHRRLTCDVFAATASGDPAAAGPYDAVEFRRQHAGLSALARKILALEQSVALSLAASPDPRYAR
jgi:A/G-specific adenine glycosylase